MQPSKSREEHVEEWKAQVRQSEAAVRAMAASGVDWSQVGKNLSAKDLSVRLGPMLTEAEFKAHCQEQGIKNPTVIRKDGP